MELTREVFDKLREEFISEVNAQLDDEEHEQRALAALDVSILRTMLWSANPQTLPQPKPKTRGGRPPGAKNKPKNAVGGAVASVEA